MKSETAERHPRDGAPCMDDTHEHIDRYDARACGCPHLWNDNDYCNLCGADGRA